MMDIDEIDELGGERSIGPQEQKDIDYHKELVDKGHPICSSMVDGPCFNLVMNCGDICEVCKEIEDSAYQALLELERAFWNGTYPDL